VKQSAAVRRETAVDHAPERTVVLVPDVLEHAHRHERVVRALDLAVVVLAELDPVSEPHAARPFARVRDLRRGILSSLGFAPGQRALDIGCGWGPLLDAIRRRGGVGVGLTLSPRQADACRRAGLDARLLDWREADPAALGRFDAVSSMGAFEHFCSPSEAQAGAQDDVYQRFFGLCAELLPPGGRLFLQTMTLGKNSPPLDASAVSAPRGSDAHLLAVLMKFYPGSFLPAGLEQIERCARPWFGLRALWNGRKDYIRTMDAWSRVWRPTPAKLVALARALPRMARDPDLRYRLESIWNGYNKECFRRELFDHLRLVLERPQ
jgi:cyclopropane-fatty-acyl-phospholipid synthase